MTVEESDEETESDFNDSSDSDFESLFGSMSKDDNMSEDIEGDSDIERIVAVLEPRQKEKPLFLPKMGNQRE